MRLVRGAMLAACAAMLACGTARAADAPQAVSIAIGGRTIMCYLPATLADTLGYFKQEGVAAEFLDFAGGTKAAEAVVGGSADLMVGAYQYTMLLQQKGVPLTEIALLTTSPAVVIALSKAKAADYKTPRDLKGLVFGVTAPGSNSEMALDTLLATVGMSKNDLSIIGVGSEAGAVAAVKAGRLDGMVNFDPIMTKLVQEGDLVPILDARTKAGTEFLYHGPFVSASVVASPAWLDAHRAAAEAFARAIVHALHFIQSASVDDIMKAVPPSFYGHDEAAYRAALGANRAVFSPDGVMPMAASANTYRVLVESGGVPPKPEVDLAKTFDNSFVQSGQGGAQ